MMAAVAEVVNFDFKDVDTTLYDGVQKASLRATWVLPTLGLTLQLGKVVQSNEQDCGDGGNDISSG